jgi:hypothetical protein
MLANELGTSADALSPAFRSTMRSISWAALAPAGAAKDVSAVIDGSWA